MARRTSSSSRRSAPRATSTAEGFEPRDHIELGRMLGAIDLERGAKVSGCAVLLPDRGRRRARAGADQPGDGAGPRGRLHPGDRAVAGQAAGDGRHRLPRPGGRRRLPDRGRGPLPRRHLGGPDGGVPLRRDPRGQGPAAALRRVQPLLPQGGRLARQGHQGHHPGALVRQGRDVRLRDPRGLLRRAPEAAGLGEGRSSTSSSWPTASSTSPPATSGCRRSASSTARRGSPPRASTASSPRPPTAPTSRPAGSTPAAASPTARPVRSPPSTARCAR